MKKNLVGIVGSVALAAVLAGATAASEIPKHYNRFEDRSGITLFIQDNKPGLDIAFGKSYELSFGEFQKLIEEKTDVEWGVGLSAHFEVPAGIAGFQGFGKAYRLNNSEDTVFTVGIGADYHANTGKQLSRSLMWRQARVYDGIIWDTHLVRTFYQEGSNVLSLGGTVILGTPEENFNATINLNEYRDFSDEGAREALEAELEWVKSPFRFNYSFPVISSGRELFRFGFAVDF